jgi:serine/threonine protein kinase
VRLCDRRRTGKKGWRGGLLPNVDPSLIREATNHFGLTDIRPIGVPAGQKYVACAKQNGSDVVLKVVQIDGSHAPVTLERARREVGLLHEIDDAHVVKAVSPLHELGSSPPKGVAWLEEYLDGTDLTADLGSGWPWDKAAKMALDIAKGLRAVHEKRAVHRDLSPRNIRHVASGDFVLMDPGVAHYIEKSTLTGVWQPGSPGYMSPEHARAISPTEASDIFAVGVLMYQALTGTLPFDVAPDVDEYLRRLRDEKAKPIRDSRPDLSGKQAEIVDRCLNSQPARRFLDGQELVAALEALS